MENNFITTVENSKEIQSNRQIKSAVVRKTRRRQIVVPRSANISSLRFTKVPHHNISQDEFNANPSTLKAKNLISNIAQTSRVVFIKKKDRKQSQTPTVTFSLKSLQKQKTSTTKKDQNCLKDIDKFEGSIKERKLNAPSLDFIRKYLSQSKVKTSNLKEENSETSETESQEKLNDQERYENLFIQRSKSQASRITIPHVCKLMGVSKLKK